MSPLRPSLLTLRPRWPRPQEQRHVRCPSCGTRIHTSRKAISARCPRCTGPLQFQDYTLTTPHHGELATLGEIHITAACSLQGRLICGRLVNAGQLSGSIVVHGQIELQAQSQTTGEVSAMSLNVHRGAVLHARTAIGPAARFDSRHKPTAANRLLPDT